MKKITLKYLLIFTILVSSLVQLHASTVRNVFQVSNKTKVTTSELEGIAREDVALIETNFGNIDLRSISQIRISESQYYETYSLNTEESIKRKLVILVVIINDTKYTNIVVTEVANGNRESILDANSIRNGILKLHLLIDGSVIQKNQESSETQTLDGLRLASRNAFSGFGTCFKTCVASNIMEMGWIEAAACALNAPECAATFLIGCTACCVVNNNNSSPCLSHH